MQLHFKKLKIKGSSIEGKGKDSHGKYKIHGSIGGGNMVNFTKTYKKGAGAVSFQGQYNPAGQIVGSCSQGGQFYIN